MTDMSRTNVELQALSQQLRDMTTAVVAHDGLQAVEVRTVLRFINKVLQVLDQAFEDVYACLVDVRLLREDDLGSEHFSDVRRTVALIHARSRYRDAEEICSRLHHLSYEYGKAIAPILGDIQDRTAWSEVFSLLDQHEGRIIFLVNQAVGELEGLLNQATRHSLPDIRATAATRATEIREALRQFGDLKNQILGISGGAGLLELVSSRDRSEFLPVSF